MLSDRNDAVVPAQELPQISALTTIGTISLIVIFVSFQEGGHSSWNHSLEFSWKAPHPHDPEASEIEVCPSGMSGKKPLPFHVRQN